MNDMKLRKIFQGVLVAVFVFSLICLGNLKATGKADEKKGDEIKTNTFTANETNVTGKTRTKTLQVFDKLKTGTGTLYLSSDSAATPDENTIYATGDLFIQSQEGINYNTIINGRNKGNVGIGTTEAVQKLTIAGTSCIGCPIKKGTQPGPTAIRILNVTTLPDGDIAGRHLWDIVGGPKLSFQTAEVGGPLSTIMTLAAPDQKVGIENLHIKGDRGIFFERNKPPYNLTQTQIFIDNNQGMKGLNFLMSGNNGSTWNKTLFLSESGNVGIGTAAPSASLNVWSSTPAGIRLERGGASYEQVKAEIGISSNNGAPPGLGIRMSGDNGSTWKDAIHITQDGKIGVNTTQIDANSAALTVCGKIECEEIEVKDIACDFVFEDHYKLDRLSDVEEYIKVNKHLPGVPPASVTKKGVNLGEFNQILLQKVEELTLYMIELKKENEQMKREIEKLKRK